MTTQPAPPPTDRGTDVPPVTPPNSSDDPAQLREQLAQAEARLAATQQRHELEGALRDAGVIDVEAAAILAEACRGASQEADAAALVRDLKARRPYLFRASPVPASAGSALSPAVTPSTDSAIRRAADEARSGDPTAVLRYMRLRRQAT